MDNFFFYLIIGAFCGFVLLAISGTTGRGFSIRGFVFSLVIGAVGAWLGMWAAHALHLPPLFQLTVAHHTFPVVWCILGAGIFNAIFTMVTARG